MTYKGNKSMLHSKAWLKKRYIDQRRSVDEIAKELGVPPVQVYRYLDRFELRKK